MEWANELFENIKDAVYYSSLVIPAPVATILGIGITVLIALAVWRAYRGG